MHNVRPTTDTSPAFRPTKAQLQMITDGLPPAAIIPPALRVAAWQGRTLTVITTTMQRPVKDPAEAERIKALRAAEAEERAHQIARMAMITTNHRKPRKETTMAKAKKTVVSRLKTNTPKPAAPLKKPVPARAKRNARGDVARVPRKPDSESHHTIKLSEIDPKLAAKVKEARAASAAQMMAKSVSKKEQLVAFLRSPKGVTLGDITEKFGTLAHSARAAICRVGVPVTTEKRDGVTYYSVKDKA